MGTILVMPAAGSCIVTPFLPATATVPLTISKPVGQGPLARNVPADVKIVQEALNRVTELGTLGGPIPPLAVDGIVGPKTSAAILHFQKVQVPSIRPDGLVEPIKPTILRLNEIVAPVTKFDLNKKLAASLPLVREALGQAIFNVGMVLAAPGTPAGQLASDRLARHFRLDKLQPASRDLALRVMTVTYAAMAMVVNQPEMFGMLGAIDAFDVDTRNGKIAQVTMRGLFEPPLVDGKSNIRRRVRLGLGFFAPNVNAEFASFILLHELAHFTSRGDGQLIDDFGRGWFDDLFVKPLPASTRLVNADSYAGFAHECRTGSRAKPPFVKTAPGGLGGAR